MPLDYGSKFDEFKKMRAVLNRPEEKDVVKKVLLLPKCLQIKTPNLFCEISPKGKFLVMGAAIIMFWIFFMFAFFIFRMYVHFPQRNPNIVDVIT